MAVQIPMRKVGVGLAVGSGIAILVWAAKTFGGVDVPADIALAGNTVITFIVQYLVPNASEDPPNA